MQEKTVTAAGHTYSLDDPFFVLATQNPIEQEGTYPLPEAQLDRFMFNIWVDYPSFQEEVDVVKATTVETTQRIEANLDGEQIRFFQQLIRRMPVADNVINYAVELVGKTRPESERATSVVKEFVSWGAGPRASQNLILAAKTTCSDQW